MNKFTRMLLLMVAQQSLSAQTAGKELQKVRDAYVAAKQLSFDVEAYSYATKNDKTPALAGKGFVKKNNDLYYSNFKEYELMVNGEKAVIVNKTARSISYYEYKADKKKIPASPQAGIDSLLAGRDSVVIRPAKDGMKHFTCYAKKGFIKQTELYVDAQTNLVTHILYYYVASNDEYEMEADRVEIFYKNIQTTNVDPHFFTFDKFFKSTRSTYVPVGKYQGYAFQLYNSKS